MGMPAMLLEIPIQRGRRESKMVNLCTIKRLFSNVLFVYYREICNTSVAQAAKLRLQSEEFTDESSLKLTG